MQCPTFRPGDLVIMTPENVRALNDPDLPDDRFHLVRVTADKGKTFDFELVDSGPLAAIEGIAICLAPKGSRTWMPPLGRIPIERSRRS